MRLEDPAVQGTAPVRPSGPALAAALAAGLGVLGLAIAQVLSEMSPGVKGALQALGNLWIPGAPGIGPYSGKETVALLTWLISWGVLHGAWRTRELPVTTIGVTALFLVGVATTLLWPPVTELFVHH